jgi:DNA modification methylase
VRNEVLVGDILDMAGRLATGSIQTIATSPPYWGLRAYHVPPTEWPSIEYAPMPGVPPVAVPAQTVCLGQEADPLSFIGHLVHVFRCLRPALREDGTLWLNLGDSYGHGTSAVRQPSRTSTKVSLAQHDAQGGRHGGAAKNLVGIPWRAAFALQADGWTLRSEVIWHKVAPMPESVTDRPTKAHEQVFLFSKGPRYFYDADAIREEPATLDRAGERRSYKSGSASSMNGGEHQAMTGPFAGLPLNPAGRNKRTVWSPPPAQFPGAHFATFPPDLIRPCILAGTSARGACAACGAAWRRVVERTDEVSVSHRGSTFDRGKTGVNGLGRVQAGERFETRPTGDWCPSCTCGATVVPCLILDPFMGSGTTAEVAVEEGRDWLGIDADPHAVGWAAERLASLPETALNEAEWRGGGNSARRKMASLFDLLS